MHAVYSFPAGNQEVFGGGRKGRGDEVTGGRGDGERIRCSARAALVLRFIPSPRHPFSLSASSRLRFASSLSLALDDEERDVVNGGPALPEGGERGLDLV